jgi:hypothetical protein
MKINRDLLIMYDRQLRKMYPKPRIMIQTKSRLSVELDFANLREGVAIMRKRLWRSLKREHPSNVPSPRGEVLQHKSP